MLPEGAVTALREARAVAVLTGAGISAESNLATYRDGQQSLWAGFNPEELATPEAYRRQPRVVWEWYAERRAKLLEAEPNPAHLALAELERRVPRFTLLTQNVDGLHQRAGSRNVHELHGSILRFKCADDGRPVDSWDDDHVPPRCPRCLGLIRPDVVWFGEVLPYRVLALAAEAVTRCDLFLTIGTSAVVYPAAGFPLEALDRGATVIEINTNETAISDLVTWHLPGKAGAVLPALVTAAWGAAAPGTTTVAPGGDTGDE